ncbi:MAG: chromosome segregation protein SMC [Candidatus Jordarchaeales archaeon]
MVATVHIKKIVIRGFKSFGNRKVTVNFSKGFVVVVGPNGSGKSNLLDAIRFGIGMLSAKSMRAGSFSDLIFYSKGGGGKAAKYATVSLYLDNVDRRIPVDADTVVITRQIDLDGKGVYRLNGRVVSRSQIVDLLEAAGISPDGYNMIPQGEILEVIRKGPVEIRRLFEDIAGIASFDEKKEKAQKELEVAEQNLRENLAQVREVQSIVERLAREREGALKYQQLDEEIRALRAKFCLAQLKRESEKLRRVMEEINEKREKIRVLQNKMGDLQDRKQKAVEDARLLDAEIALVEENIRNLVSELNEKRKAASEKKITVSFKEKELAERLNRFESLKREIESIKNRLMEESRALEEALAERKRLSEETDAKQRVLEALYEQAASVDTEYVKVREELDRFRVELDGLRKEEARLEAEKKIIERELANGQASLLMKKKRLDGLRNALESMKRELALLGEEKRKEEEREKALSSELREVEAEEGRKGRELREVEALLQKLREEIIRIRAINEERERILRSQSAVYEILKLRDKGVLKGIYGTIAELGKTREEYALALEAAAGQRLNYIVVENDEVAVECINFLKKNGLGRATFIPLNLIRSRPRPVVEDDKGVVGAAVDLIEFDEKFRPAFEYVFGNTIIVKGLDVARRLHNVKARKVTLEGEILETSGVMVGGHIQKRQAVFLQEPGELPKLENELKGMEELRASIMMSIKSLVTRKQNITRELKQAEREVYVHEARIRELNERISSLEGEVNELEEEVKRYVEENAKKEEELRKVVELLYGVRSRISLTNESISRLEEAASMSKTAALQNQIRELEKEMLTLKDKLGQLEVKIAEKQTLIGEHLMGLLREKERELSKVKVEMDNVESDLNATKEDLDMLMSEVTSLERRRAELEDKLVKIRTEREKLEKEVSNLSVELEKTSEKVKELELEARGAEVEKSFLEETLNELKKQAEDYSSYSFEDIDSVDFRELDEMIKSKEKEKKSLEPVNMLAIELYEKERKRYEELISKRNKLIEERESILSFIKEVEKDKRNTFLSTFYAIEKNFKQIFSSLSPGGSARFVLENPIDPFSGGVIIEASPAGKEVKRLELMSGGEKSITSLALIFAIQQYHPAPFYVMDEIDAFLDEQNSSRVADLIKELSKTSQFIVVSLRKATMKKADQIIGVTYMNGSSCVFSIDANLKQLEEQYGGGGEVAA